MCPSYFYYAKYEGLKSSSHGYYNSFVMLGNMGFNKAVCISNYVELDSPAQLNCSIGYMSNITAVGILPDTLDMNNVNMPYGYCGDPRASLGYLGNNGDSGNGTAYCSSNFINPTIVTDWEDNCLGN